MSAATSAARTPCPITSQSSTAADIGTTGNTAKKSPATALLGIQRWQNRTKLCSADTPAGATGYW
jgi:hypothetical protein